MVDRIQIARGLNTELLLLFPDRVFGCYPSLYWLINSPMSQVFIAPCLPDYRDDEEWRALHLIVATLASSPSTNLSTLAQMLRCHHIALSLMLPAAVMSERKKKKKKEKKSISSYGYKT